MDPIEARLAAAGCVAAAEETVALRAVAADADALDALVRRREEGEPLAWITGRVEFCGHALRTESGVYVPRPQTEELARRGAALLPDDGRAVDLCTGCGAIAVHLSAERPGATVVAVDLDPFAVGTARSNGVSAVVGAVEAVPLRSGGFDVVTAVAPYVPTDAIPLLPPDVQRHEPRRALNGGDDGLAVVRLVVAAAARLLRSGGHLLTELGGDQAEVLAPALAGAGFTAVEAWSDEDGDVRGIAARRA